MCVRAIRKRRAAGADAVRMSCRSCAQAIDASVMSSETQSAFQWRWTLGSAPPNLAPLLEREWLETNGLGGFASGTVSCANTRRYHALLVAALQPPGARMA